MAEQEKPLPTAFTRRYPGLVRDLKIDVGIDTYISQADPNKTLNINSFEAIWDTGAQNSVITSKVVKKLALKPIGKVQVHGVNSSDIVSKYLVNVFLPNY